MPVGFAHRRLVRIVIGCACICAICFVIYKIIQYVFVIQSIEVVGSGIAVQVDNKKLSKNLLFFPSDKLRAAILNDNPILSDVQFQKKYPHTLRIVPILRTPIIRLRTPSRVVLVDKSGIVLADADGTERLPEVVLDMNGVRIGELIREKRVQFSLQLIYGLGDVFPIEKITQADDAALIATSGQTTLLVSIDRAVSDILSTLQTLMTGFRIKGTLPTVVDLRFDKPVIKF